jgi:hypothetical protein
MAIPGRNDKLRRMPSSNFLRRRWPVYLSLAIALGAVSSAVGQWLNFVDAANRQGLLYWWFMGVPAEIYAWIGPSERYQHLVWSGLFTLQYLVVFAAGAGIVIFLQRRSFQGQQPAAAPAPPERLRAFETAAAMYCQADVSDVA